MINIEQQRLTIIKALDEIEQKYSDAGFVCGAKIQLDRDAHSYTIVRGPYAEFAASSATLNVYVYASYNDGKIHIAPRREYTMSINDDRVHLITDKPEVDPEAVDSQ